MATREAAQTYPLFTNVAELQEHLGGIPLERIRLQPPPGKATLKDVLEIDAHEDRICELIDGTLVEKVMHTYEAYLSGLLAYFLNRYLDEQNLGVVLGGGGYLEISPGQVRAPDISFISWKSMPNQAFPDEEIASLVPDLAVELLSPGNTEGEMRRKLQDYFQAGSNLVWLIDHKTWTARVHTSPGRFVRLTKDDTLTGGEVLPGFRLPIQAWYARANRRPGR